MLRIQKSSQQTRRTRDFPCWFRSWIGNLGTPHDGCGPSSVSVCDHHDHLFGFINPFQSISDRWLGFLGFTIEISIDDNPSSYGHFYRWYRYIISWVSACLLGFLVSACVSCQAPSPRAHGDRKDPQWTDPQRRQDQLQPGGKKTHPPILDVIWPYISYMML